MVVVGAPAWLCVTINAPSCSSSLGRGGKRANLFLGEATGAVTSALLFPVTAPWQVGVFSFLKTKNITKNSEETRLEMLSDGSKSHI